MDEKKLEKKDDLIKVKKKKEDCKPKYSSPEIITYSGDDILKELGTAKACSPFPP